MQEDKDTTFRSANGALFLKCLRGTDSDISLRQLVITTKPTLSRFWNIVVRESPAHNIFSRTRDPVEPPNYHVEAVLYIHIRVLFPNARLSLQPEHCLLSSVVLFSRFPTTRVKIPLWHRRQIRALGSWIKLGNKLPFDHIHGI